ncbi:hypothetical protein K7432_013331 [Basidiobolus ranarum]|uniref:Protein kinase domain-containing protein n=1 Tax=Basidiobolus ranarum TaxID=34480 RepID=A0ABR2WJF6_9FUNG
MDIAQKIFDIALQIRDAYSKMEDVRKECKLFVENVNHIDFVIGRIKDDANLRNYTTEELYTVESEMGRGLTAITTYMGYSKAIQVLKANALEKTLADINRNVERGLLLIHMHATASIVPSIKSFMEECQRNMQLYIYKSKKLAIGAIQNKKGKHVQVQLNATNFTFKKSLKNPETGEEIAQEGLFMEYEEVRVIEVKGISGNQSSSALTEEEIFYKELAINNILRSPRTLAYYGAFCENNKTFMVVEKFGNKTLSDLLTDGSCNVDGKIKYQIALDICKGIHYLHKIDIIHRYLSSHVILVGENYRIKISDFHRSKFSDKTSSMGRPISNLETERWEPPEYFDLQKENKKGGDIYSLGLILRELATGLKPFDTVSDDENIIKIISESDDILKLNPIPDSINKDITNLIVKCLSINPDDRPFSGRVIQILENMDIKEF